MAPRSHRAADHPPARAGRRGHRARRRLRRARSLRTGPEAAVAVGREPGARAARRPCRARLRADIHGTDGGRRDCVLHPLAVPVVQPQDAGADAPLFRADGAICSLPVSLASAAGRSGFLNAVPDSTAFSGACRSSSITTGPPTWPAARGGSRRHRREASRAARQEREHDRRSSSRPGRSRSTGEATCSSATAARSGRFPTSPPWTCSPAAMPATSSRTPSSSSGRRRSAAGRWCRRRSTRGSPGSRCRRRSPTICCAATSCRAPSTR